MITRLPLGGEVSDEFAAFFRSLGYHVTWDFSKRTGLHWYEICDEEGLICQVDFDTPLAEFIADLPELAEGRPGKGPSNYEVRCPDENNGRLRAMLDTIRAKRSTREGK